MSILRGYKRDGLYDNISEEAELKNFVSSGMTTYHRYFRKVDERKTKIKDDDEVTTTFALPLLRWVCVL